MKTAMVSFAALFFLVFTGHASNNEASLQRHLQFLIDGATLLTKGTALSLGVALPSQTISLTSGHTQKGSDAKDSGSVDPSDGFAMGSTAKMYTAAAVLRMVDSGKFALDDKALPLFDTLWTKLNGSSIVNLLGPQIKDVTVRHLLQMRSGIPDFDNMESRGYQFDHPSEDLGPVKEMNFLEQVQSFDCAPGTCGEYSSSNYELLGLILAQQSGAESWDKYTQAASLPKDVLAQMPNTAFAVHGPCSKYTKMHAYSAERTPPVDVFNVSCTNGWTCGNLISNGADAAFFVRALLGGGERVLKASTQKEMISVAPLTRGWSTGLLYGLGVMDFSKMIGQPAGSLVGHGGETYGFNAQTFYARDHDFGISIVANTESTMLVSSLLPRVYAAVVKALSTSKVGAVVV